MVWDDVNEAWTDAWGKLTTLYEGGYGIYRTGEPGNNATSSRNFVLGDNVDLSKFKKLIIVGVYTSTSGNGTVYAQIRSKNGTYHPIQTIPVGSTSCEWKLPAAETGMTLGIYGGNPGGTFSEYYTLTAIYAK